jgi:hypothetical protein
VLEKHFGITINWIGLCIDHISEMGRELLLTKITCEDIHSGLTVVENQLHGTSSLGTEVFALGTASDK